MSERGRARAVFRLGGRHQIIDDRRVRVPLCEAAQLGKIAPSNVREAVRSANEHRWGPVIVSSIIISAIGLYFMGILGGKSLLVQAIIAGTYFSSIAAALLAIGAISARANSITAIKALHRAGLCPSCGYDIAAVAPAEDGCTVCPECGAAWRRSAAAAEGQQ